MSTIELEANTEIHEDSQIDSQFVSILSTLSQFKIQITVRFANCKIYKGPGALRLVALRVVKD